MFSPTNVGVALALACWRTGTGVCISCGGCSASAGPTRVCQWRIRRPSRRLRWCSAFFGITHAVLHNSNKQIWDCAARGEYVVLIACSHAPLEGSSAVLWPRTELLNLHGMLRKHACDALSDHLPTRSSYRMSSTLLVGNAAMTRSCDACHDPDFFT